MKEALKLALEWAEAHGEIVFAGGGTSAVAGMNAWAAALKEALAQPAQEPVALDVTIEGDAAKILAAMLEPMLDEPTAIRLLVGSGYLGYGLYVAASEYQDEGAVFLVNTTPPAEQPAQPAQEPDELTIAYMSGLYDGKKKRPWIGLTYAQFLEAARLAETGNYLVAFQRIQQWLQELNT